MKAIILITILIISFSAIVCQSRMRPSASQDDTEITETLYNQSDIVADSEAEPLLYGEYEEHTHDLIYRRSRFADSDSEFDYSTIDQSWGE